MDKKTKALLDRLAKVLDEASSLSAVSYNLKKLLANPKILP